MGSKRGPPPIPLAALAREADTIAVCLACGRTAIHGGPIVPDLSFISRLDQCAFGDGWSWCVVTGAYRADEG